MCLLCTADLFDPAVLGFGQTSQTLPGLGGMEGSPGNTGTLSQPQSSLISAGNHSTVLASGDSTIDGLLIGTAWAEPTLNFAFPSDSSFFTSPYEIAPGQMDTGYVNSFVATSAAFQTVVRDMMSDLDGMLAVTFVETANTDAELVFARTTDTDLGTASGRFPSYGANQGHQWYRNHIYEQSPTMGSYTWATILHETGHTLGLAHAHSADSISGDFVGQVQPSERDNMEFTVMSYRSYENAPTTGYRNETYGFAQSFMMDDIAAMQYLYGADFTMNSGDTVYTFSTTTGEMFVDGVGQGTPGDNRIFRTLWDGDGTDTYDLSNYSQALEIDLTPGGWSKLDDAQRVDLGNGNLARANVYNARLFEEDARSLIENAVGGSSDDIIVGNRAKNRLEGGLGKDMLYGGGGVDTLLGGAGNDILYGDDAPPGPGAASGISLGTSTYSHGNTHGSFANAFEITDRFSFDDDANIADATTLAHTSLSFTGPGSGTVPAQYYAITITRGTVLILDLDDSANLDSWINVYNAGQEVLAFNDDAGGDPGSETEPYDAGLTFTAPTDGLYYIAVGRYSGGTFLNATSEYTLHVSVTEPGPSPALGTDGTGAKDILWGGAGDDQIFGGLGSDESWGEAGDDILEGGLGNDTLDGGADNDQLYGANGHDTLRGGSGDDLLNPWTGNDTLDGGEGVDTVDYSDFGSAISVNLLDLAPQLVSNAAGTDQFANIENILGSKGGDTLTGSHGNNRIEGGGGNDTIFGQKGDDVILGGAQNDTLRGNNGDDILIGGLGRDIMGGGRGADVFVFQDPSETVNGGFRDRIQDFNRNEDLLDLSAMDADLTSAVDSFTFMNNAAFTSGAGGQLRAFKVTATNKTIVEGEVDGDGKKDFQFELTGLINLTADHFIL